MKEKNEQNREILKEITAVRSQIEAARSFCDNVTEDSLVSAGIFQLNALQSQYVHLLTVAKQMNVTSLCCLRHGKTRSIR